MKRRDAREQAFLLIFEMSFHDEEAKATIAQAIECRDLEVDEFASNLAGSAQERREEVDKLISEYSTRWKIDRISRVALALLRMAICEILEAYSDVPIGVSINEAVELAKKYGGEEDAPFINGVLGAIVRDRKPNEAATES